LDNVKVKCPPPCTHTTIIIATIIGSERPLPLAPQTALLRTRLPL
jgi:hypothetical protein